VEKALATAQRCQLGAAGACGKTVPGLCCPVVVGEGNSAETNAYLETLAKFKDVCPNYIYCTQAICPAVYGSCVSSGPRMPAGVCETHNGAAE
jgi:hypothetical protein